MASEIVVPKPITASTSTNDNEIERLQSPPLTQMLHDLSLKNTASAVVYRIVLTGGPCGGKCWGRGTELMMWDGSVKKVEDIREGEWLMGDDSSPRVVRHGSLKRGNTEKDAAEFVPSEKQRVAPATYRITSANNQNALWTCNGDHILVLQIDDAPTIQSVGDDQYSVFAWQLENPSTPALTRVTPDSFPTIETAEEFRVDYMTKTLWRPLQFETDVNDFSLLSKDVRTKCKMFIMPQVHYSESGAKASIANRLQEILPSVIVAEDDESAWALGYILGGGDLDHANVQARLDAWTVAIGSVLPASELLHQLLAIYGVPVPGFGIPSELLTSSAQLRRALLAGIIDAAGRMDDDAVIVNGTAPFMTAVVQLARSLGFVTSRLESSVSLGDDTAVRISGSELSELKTNLSNTLAKLTVEEDLRSFAFECERVDHADYFGFTVCTPTGGETNGRFLMGDFVVTHNTTAMGTLTERFQALGWRVFRVPEAATMLLSGGHTFANLNKQQQYQFQAALLKLMMSLEEAFITLARSTHERCIVLCDRGTMDCRSYMPEDEWEQLTREVGMSTLQLRDERYDCVLHLVTAANGAAGFYTTEGHAARTEPPEFARELDLRVKNNWIGHPHYHVIDNVNTDFNGKIRRVMSTICQFVGLPGSIGMSKRKLLVKASCIKKVGAPEDSKKGDRIDFPESIRYQRFEVDHDYILRPDQDQGHQLRLRRRGLNGQYTYSYTLRYPDLHGQRVELKRLVTRREYFDLILQKDPSTQTVSKKRYSFLYNDQYFELDQFISPHPGLYLLEFYFEKDKPIDGIIPPFLEIEREVTGEKEYSMYNLARIGNHRSTKSLMAEDDLASALLHTKSSANDGHHHFSLTHAAASAPTSPQIKPASNALQVPNHKV